MADQLYLVDLGNQGLQVMRAGTAAAPAPAAPAPDPVYPVPVAPTAPPAPVGPAPPGRLMMESQWPATWPHRPDVTGPVAPYVPGVPRSAWTDGPVMPVPSGIELLPPDPRPPAYEPPTFRPLPYRPPAGGPPAYQPPAPTAPPAPSAAAMPQPVCAYAPASWPCALAAPPAPAAPPALPAPPAPAPGQPVCAYAPASYPCALAAPPAPAPAPAPAQASALITVTTGAAAPAATGSGCAPAPSCGPSTTSIRAGAAVPGAVGPTPFGPGGISITTSSGAPCPSRPCSPSPCPPKCPPSPCPSEPECEWAIPPWEGVPPDRAPSPPPPALSITTCDPQGSGGSSVTVSMCGPAAPAAPPAPVAGGPGMPNYPSENYGDGNMHLRRTLKRETDKMALRFGDVTNPSSPWRLTEEYKTLQKQVSKYQTAVMVTVLMCVLAFLGSTGLLTSGCPEPISKVAFMNHVKAHQHQINKRSVTIPEDINFTAKKRNCVKATRNVCTGSVLGQTPAPTLCENINDVISLPAALETSTKQQGHAASISAQIGLVDLKEYRSNTDHFASGPTQSCQAFPVMVCQK